MRRLLPLFIAISWILNTGSTQAQALPGPTSTSAPHTTDASGRSVPLYVAIARERASKLRRLEESLHARELALKEADAYRRFERMRRAGIVSIATGAGVGVVSLCALLAIIGFDPDPEFGGGEHPILIGSGLLSGSLLLGGAALLAAPPRYHPLIREVRAIHKQRTVLRRQMRELRKSVIGLALTPQLNLLGERSVGLTLSIAM